MGPGDGVTHPGAPPVGTDGFVDGDGGDEGDVGVDVVGVDVVGVDVVGVEVVGVDVVGVVVAGVDVGTGGICGVSGVGFAVGLPGSGGVTIESGGVHTPDRQIHSGLGGLVGQAGPFTGVFGNAGFWVPIVGEAVGLVVGAFGAVLGVALRSTHRPPTQDQPAPGCTPRHAPAPLPLPPPDALGACHVPF